MSFARRFEDVWVLDGLRTQVDHQGAFADANPIDPGINAASAVMSRAGIEGASVDSVLAGAIALGHPLAATGVRLTIKFARQLQEIGARWGMASACVGGGQGIALLVENPAAA